MTNHNLAIRLSVTEAAKVKTKLRDVGDVGHVLDSMEGMGRRLGMMGAVLTALGPVSMAAGATSRFHVTGGGYGASGWSGATLYRSVGRRHLDSGRVRRERRGVAWGATLNALGPPQLSPFCTDETNTLTVFMTTGGNALESVTHEAMVNGANPALVIKTNGEVEIIQFRDVTPNATGSYMVRGLLFTAGAAPMCSPPAIKRVRSSCCSMLRTSRP